eukprot:5004169-Heterocapsa_arctica.AAC.1
MRRRALSYRRLTRKTAAGAIRSQSKCNYTTIAISMIFLAERWSCAQHQSLRVNIEPQKHCLFDA